MVVVVVVAQSCGQLHVFSPGLMQTPLLQLTQVNLMPGKTIQVTGSYAFVMFNPLQQESTPTAPDPPSTTQGIVVEDEVVDDVDVVEEVVATHTPLLQ